MSDNPDLGNRNHEHFVRVQNGVPTALDDSPLNWIAPSGLRPTDEWLAAQEGISWLGWVETPQPSYDPDTEKVTEVPLANLTPSNGVITQAWTVSDMTPEEIANSILELRQDINDYREELIIEGCTVDIANVGVIAVSGRPEDIRNMAGLGQGALTRIVLGDTVTEVPFRDDNDDVYNLTPPQMLELWQKSAGYVSAIYQASWAIKEMDPIPRDYANTAYWPSNEL